MTVFTAEKMGTRFTTEIGTSPQINSVASVIKGTITLQSNFAREATCLVGIKTCSLATGEQAGVVTVTKQEFVAPNTIEVTAELPGAGSVGGRDLYSAEFNYVVTGQAS